MTESLEPLDFSGALESVEDFLLQGAPTLTRVQVSELADVPLEIAHELWRLLGFATAGDDEVVFTELDVEALRLTRDLMAMDVLNEETQAALVRTWGRSFARLAEWQTSTLARIAMRASDTDPLEQIIDIAENTLPRIEFLQSYIWRRHLLTAGRRMLMHNTQNTDMVRQAVVFCDIVGYTSRSKELNEVELVSWLEGFESACAGIALEHGARIIKNIGDEVLLVCDELPAALDCALTMTRLGSDPEDSFPEVRAGVAYGDVVSRLGDVFGATVNIASRLTTIARPSTVVVDSGVRKALLGDDSQEHEDSDDYHGAEESAYTMRRLRRVSVKGYSRLPAWVLRGPGIEWTAAPERP